ncbi:MAG: hypothetical protein QXM43_02870 [Desulfurococcaceae archaeon]
MGEGVVPLHVLLPRSLYDKLEKYVKEKRVTKADVIRALLEWYLERELGGSDGEEEEGS